MRIVRIFVLFTVLPLLAAVLLSKILYPSALPPAPDKVIIASHNQKSARFSIDGYLDTRWDTGEFQTPGQNVVLDLGESQQIQTLTLNTAGSPRDYPRGLRVEVAEQMGEWFLITELWPAPAKEILTLDVNHLGRYIRLVQTGRDDNFYWSIHELEVASERVLAPYSLLERTIRFAALWFGGLLVLLASAASLRCIKRCSLPLLSAARISSCVFVALLALPAALDAEFVWGFSWFIRSPWFVQIALLFVWGGVLLWAPGIAAWWSTSALPIMLKRRAILAYLVPVAFFVLCWLFRSRTCYGDCHGTIQLLATGELINWKEPLDRLFTALVYRAGHALFGMQPETAIALTSCFAGTLFLLGCIRLAAVITSVPSNRSLIVLTMISTGAVQLFFGNLENYSLLSAGIVWYLSFGISLMQRRAGLLIPSLVLGITASFHLSAAWLGPSFAVLTVLHWRHGEKARVSSLAMRLWRLILTALVYAMVNLAPLALTLAAVFYLKGSASEFTLANMGGGDGKLWVTFTHPFDYYEPYSFLSFNHLYNIANELLLLCPSALMLMLACLMRKGWRRIFRPAPEVLFLCTAVLGGLAYLLFFNPDLAFLNVGILNEWDLFSLIAFPVTALAIFIWSRCGEACENERQAVLVITIATGVVFALPWLLANAQL